MTNAFLLPRLSYRHLPPVVHRFWISTHTTFSVQFIVLAMSAALLLLLALSPHLISSYNVDTHHPIVYKDPDSSGSNYFGYSVSLNLGKNGLSSSSLFVGAPQSLNGTGNVYRCTKSSTCTPLEIKDEAETRPGWLGASMATGENSDFTVCAPRTIVPTRILNFYFYDLHGVCYTILGGNGNVVSRDSDAKMLSYHDPKFNIAHGFSVHYETKSSDTTHGSSTIINRIIGLPGSSSVDVRHGPRRVMDGWTPDSDIRVQGISRLGYSVSSGYYRGGGQLYFAAGAPAWSRKGMVTIFAPFQLNTKMTQIHGKVLGEYFGGSLATGDFDNDGYDDLAIGAPHWGTVDIGRVYTYHTRGEGRFEQGQMMQGKVGNGQFGYTLASADLDHDGFSDLVIGAPWEGSGAVYIYYGNSEFGKQNPSGQIIQRIEPSGFHLNNQIQRFGFSLSHPVDIDGNGYPDLAIGAYESGHAFILRSRPVIRTMIKLESYPTMLQTNDTGFTVSVCVTYSGRRAPESQEMSISMVVDAKHNRVESGSLKELDGLFFLGRRTCRNTTVSLIKSEGRNVLDPIDIEVTHSIKRGVDGSKIDAVLHKTSVNKKGLTVSFNTGCEGGRVCISNVSVSTSFEDVGADGVWLIGSGDISLNLVWQNDKEPAYLTRSNIRMPSGIRLRKAIQNCEEIIFENALTLSCLVANPLENGKPQRMSIDLDMRNVDMESINGSSLIFKIARTTQSQDKDAISNRVTVITLETKNKAQVTLTGATDKKNLDYSRTDEKDEVLIRHTYQVLKSGPSPITKASLTIDVPTSMVGRGDWFLNISDTELVENSGQTQLCIIDDTSFDDGLLLKKRRTVSEPSTSEEMQQAEDDGLRNDTNKEDKTLVKTTDNIIYLNCSTEGVSCTRLTCPFQLLNNNEDVANVVLETIFNASKFYTSDQDSLTVNFHTNARVDIVSPFISDSTDISIRSAGVSTTLYNIPAEPKKLSGWLLPASIVFGILLFCILAIILFRIGFFKRSTKLENAKAKETELMLKVDDATEDEAEHPD